MYVCMYVCMPISAMYTRQAHLVAARSLPALLMYILHDPKCYVRPSSSTEISSPVLCSIDALNAEPLPGRRRYTIEDSY